jgi:hypothetical protein
MSRHNPPTCPSCRSSKTWARETRRLADGGRRRRHECHDCGYRWTSWEGAQPRRGRSPGARSNRQRAPFTPEDVRLILISPLSSPRLARQLACSKQAICAVRRGLSHAQEWPELPRRLSLGGATCLDCQHWARASCGMGLPDPIAEGPGFARDCSLFEAMKKGP